MKAYAVLHKTTKAVDGSTRWAVSTHDGRLIAMVRKERKEYMATSYGTKSCHRKSFLALRPIVQWAIDNENK